MSDQTTPDPKRKTFELAKRNSADDPIVEFDLNGVTFHLHPNRINPMVILDLLGSRIEDSSQSMWEFFSGVLGSEYQQFRRIVRDPDLVFDADQILALLQWMTEQTSALPLGQSAS